MFDTARQMLTAGMVQIKAGLAFVEPNKVAGSVLLFLLSIWVIGMIGDGLVHPRQKPAAVVASGGEAAKPAPKAEEKVEPVSALLASASVEKGGQVFKKCTACHTSDKGGAKKVGPNLWNIVNAKQARSSDFSYSKAMAAKGGNWSFESLNEFLAKPKAYMPGTKMAFAGLNKVSDRANVIAYLRSLSDSPAPLP